MSEKIVHKSPEIIKAQVAAFAAERVEDRDNQNQIFTNLGNLAAGDLKPDKYVDFLRSVGGSKYEAIQGRADMFTEYEETFAPAVDRLRKELTDPATRKTHPALLGDR